MGHLIGPHRIWVGDFLEDSIGVTADVIYTDPPWGHGALRLFSTQAQLDQRPWPQWIAEFAARLEATAALGAPIIVEMGLKWSDDLDAAMAAAGLVKVRGAQMNYGHPPRPQAVGLWTRSTRHQDPLGEAWDSITWPPTKNGEATTLAILTPFVRQGSVVVDPCTGLGQTARCAAKLGGIFHGMELVPARAARAAASLAKYAGTP